MIATLTFYDDPSDKPECASIKLQYCDNEYCASEYWLSKDDGPKMLVDEGIMFDILNEWFLKNM